MKYLTSSHDKQQLQPVYRNSRADLPSIPQVSINYEATENACRLADQKLALQRQQLLAAKRKFDQLSKEENNLMSVAQDVDNSIYK